MDLPSTPSAAPRRAVLLLAMILGVLAMHHVATTVTSAPMTHTAVAVADQLDPAAPPAHGDSGGHDGGQHMLAACPAVLTAGVALLVVLWLFGTLVGPGAVGGRSHSIGVRHGRGPPFAPPTANRLARLCILRV